MVNFYLDDAPLVMGDAVALILIDDDGRYLLQHRDDIEGIWYPDNWGCFGGASEQGETPLQAIKREIWEEIGFVPDRIEPFCSLDFDMSDTGSRVFYRRYFKAQITQAQVNKISLGEGKNYGLFTPEELDGQIKIVPYDSFALLLHHKRSNLFDPKKDSIA